MTRTQILSWRAAVARVVVAVALLVIGVITVAALWRAGTAADADEEARAELRARAGTIVADVFSVESSSWQQDRARARELVSEEFTTTYGAQLDRPLDAGTVAVTWRPEIVSLVDADARDGTALMRVAVTVRGESTPASTAYRTVEADFVRTGDAWLLARADVVG